MEDPSKKAYALEKENQDLFSLLYFVWTKILFKKNSGKLALLSATQPPHPPTPSPGKVYLIAETSYIGAVEYSKQYLPNLVGPLVLAC